MEDAVGQAGVDEGRVAGRVGEGAGVAGGVLVEEERKGEVKIA